MTNVQELKAKLAFNDLSIGDVATALNLSYLQTHRKLKGEANFTQPEIKKMQEVLKLKDDEVMTIFFG